MRVLDIIIYLCEMSSAGDVDRMEVVFGDEVCEVFREAVSVAVSGVVDGKGGKVLILRIYWI